MIANQYDWIENFENLANRTVSVPTSFGWRLHYAARLAMQYAGDQIDSKEVQITFDKAVHQIVVEDYSG